MGASLCKSCIPKKKKQKDDNNVLNKSQTKHERPFTNQYLLNENLSSEINLLNQLRDGKEKFQRPKGIEFRGLINCKPVIRIASWNVNNLTTEKVMNPGVLTVICLTILENNLSVIALQEVINKEAVEIVCNELNNPTLTKIKLSQNSRAWGFVMSDEPVGKGYQGHEYGTLIYDKSKGIKILASSQLNSSTLSKSFIRNPFLVNVNIQKSFYLLAIFHIKAVTDSSKKINDSRTSEELEDLSTLADAINQTIKVNHKVIILGDFNLNPTDECLKEKNFMYCIDSSLSTNTSKKSGKSYDNIWINKSCELYYTGSSGIISEGLYHKHIPKNGMMGWGGCASDHRPVWADFFTRL